MGKRSAEAEAMEIVSLPSPKMAAPKSLTPEQAQIWREMIARTAVFQVGPDNAPVMEELVRHISYSRQIARELDGLGTSSTLKSPKTRTLFIQLARAHAMQTKCIAELATKMRLTPQSINRDPVGVARKEAGASEIKPWDDWNWKSQAPKAPEPHQEN